VFFKLLDGLKERSDKGNLWITDHISQHQYETERTTAAIKMLATNYQLIRLELTTQADPQFYDLPLTLVTQVPAAWQRARVKQGTRSNVVLAENNSIRFDAVPGGGVIEVRVSDGE
jgi:hypothetical protein